MRLTAGGRLPGRVSYLIGNDRRRWQTNIPTFSGATYRGVWPGIDATFTGSQHQLECVFDVAPGADPRQIRLAYRGQSGVRLDAAGDLILTAGAGRTVRQLAPRAYQRVLDKVDRRLPDRSNRRAQARAAGTDRRSSPGAARRDRLRRADSGAADRSHRRRRAVQV